jgi:hypothetical protein
MNTKTEVINGLQGPAQTPVKMVDSQYRVTIECSFADACSIELGIQSQVDSFLKHAAIAPEEKIRVAFEQAAKRLQHAAHAFAIHNLIGDCALNIGKSYRHQEAK